MEEVLLKDIPVEWVFETYLKLPEKLEGQEVCIKSPFTDDRTHSFTLFYEKNKRYFFKDFSSGRGGDHVGLVAALEGLTRARAIRKIVADYMNFLQYGGSYTPADMKYKPKYKVTDYELRTFKRSIDKPFWKDSFSINQPTLEHFNVAPISKFIMSKPLEDGTIKSLTFDKGLIYGYFNNKGDLCKIYRPQNTKKSGKFIKVKEFIQGGDQLTYKTDYLLINKSLKDVMAFYSLNIENWENVSPDSEGELLPREFMDTAKLKYKAVFTLMDPDKAGILATNKYKEVYGTIPLILNSGVKDTSDTVKLWGLEKTRSHFITEVLLRDIETTGS